MIDHMNIAVIAANGRLGKAFVEQALSEGHSVRAGVHGKNTLSPHKNLTILKCDATNLADLARLIKNQDAVVSCIGHVKNSAPDVQTKATQAIVEAMKKQGIKRFVTVTGTGVREKGDKVGHVDKFLNLAVSIVDPFRVKDGRDHAEVLKASSLDWTLIRVLKLQNVRPKEFTLKLHGPTKWYVGRQEVAKAMLQVLSQNTFIKQAPIISRK